MRNSNRDVNKEGQKLRTKTKGGYEEYVRSKGKDT